MKYYPLRPIQRWLIDTHFNKAKSTMMNIGGLYKLSAQIDTKRLESAINEVMNSYDIFHCRLVFHPETCELCQIFDAEIMPVVVEEWTDEEFKLIKKSWRMRARGYRSSKRKLCTSPLNQNYAVKVLGRFYSAN